MNHICECVNGYLYIIKDPEGRHAVAPTCLGPGDFRDFLQDRDNTVTVLDWVYTPRYKELAVDIVSMFSYAIDESHWFTFSETDLRDLSMLLNEVSKGDQA